RAQGAAGSGRIGGIAQSSLALWGKLPLQGENVVHPQRGFGEEYLFSGQIELLAEEINRLVVPAPLELQTHRRQPVAFFHDFPHVLAEVLVNLVYLILGADVRISGDRGDGLAPDLKGGEQAFSIL